MEHAATKPAEGGIDPSVAFQRGNMELDAGKPDAAISHYRMALAAAPEVVEIYNNLAAAHLERDELPLAIEVARSGLLTNDSFAPLHNTFANCLAKTGNAEEAEQHYEQALRLDPLLTAAAVNLAHIYSSSGRHDESRSVLLASLENSPDNVDVLVALGLTLPGKSEAETHLRRALELSPGHLAANNQLAIILLSSGRNLEALTLYRDLAALHPDQAEIQANLGLTLNGLSRHEDAVEAFRKASRLDPNLKNTLPYFIQSMMYQCAWEGLAPASQELLDSARRQVDSGTSISIPPFALAGLEATADLQLAVARSYSARCLERIEVSPARDLRAAPRQRGAKLRIGYLSPDFRTHSLATCLQPLLANHDREKFEWFGYFTGGGESDAVTSEFRNLFCHWRDLRSTGLRDAAQAIRKDHLDILVDLAGHTKQSGIEILGYQPAPVQAHYLGYGCTIGADCVQYLITDPVHTPGGIARFCHEHLVYLPDSFMATGSPEPIDRQVDRKSQGLPDTGFVFASFNNHYKLDPVIFDIWMRLLTATPGSVLWLMGGDVSVMNNLRQAAAKCGVDASRLIFAKRVSREAHLARLHLADLALDTRLHGGGVTTLDALGTGVPVVTLAGDAHPSRIGASLLSAAGLPELITHSLEDYERTASKLAGSRELLDSVGDRLALAHGSAPLFDPHRLARHLEWAYAEMARRSGQELEPADITVPVSDADEPLREVRST